MNHGKGWRRARTDYPEGIMAVYDLGAKRAVYERYTVVYTPEGGPERTDLEFSWCYLTEDGSYSHSSGKAWERPVSSWGLKGGAGAGNVIAFDALPVPCQRTVLRDMIPLCSECFCDDGQHYGNCPLYGAPAPYAVIDLRAPFVGREDNQHFVLRRFAKLADAERYVNTLPGVALGLYSIDGPEVLAFYECGCCGAFHSVDFAGDCREDSARIPGADVLDAVYGPLQWVEWSVCSACGTPVPEIIGCPDGAEVCPTCFALRQH